MNTYRWIINISILLFTVVINSQSKERPTLGVGKLSQEIKIDGILNEKDWENAPLLDNFKTTIPIENGTPSSKTFIRVIANDKTIIIGIDCKDAYPNEIVKFSKIRDADVSSEDHVKIVIDPFLDGQSGYIFAINAFAARYDALVSNRGESENEDWDTIWEARASINDDGWTAEISIPIQSLYFKQGLDTWGFNVERRIQRNLETIRWANVKRDQWFTQTSRAGLLTNLPKFNYGLGLNIRPSLVNKLNKSG
ncbi:MAG: carbohydrate binding family 9 domain-containing protein, partial [Flavobacteriaceae bacterium]|nr:carbohydrate binding family 9 domain-containing protein [Flavobacteriaceae bacterium]